MKSENSIPHCPWRVNTRGLAQILAVGLMKANLKSFVIDGGSAWPSHFFISGLGSNRSIWLGAPDMNR